MNDLRQFLNKIDKGDPLVILSEEKLTDGLNELLKKDLISFDDGRIQLTDKGRMVCKTDEEIFLDTVESVSDSPVEFSEVNRRKSKIIFFVSLFVLLLSIVVISFMLLSE